MSDFNSDETNAPSWMDKKYFENVLRNYEKDDTISIVDLEITPGSALGDHFASVMFRVVANYRTATDANKSISMIVKILPQVDGFKKEVLEKLTIFETEIRMYTEQMPKMEQVLRQHGDNTQLCSKIIYHSLTPNKVVIFEDLTVLGYIAIRGRLLTENEIKACYTKIAKWHAVSYKLAEEGDESTKSFKDGMLAKPKEEMPPFISDSFQSLGKGISKVDGMGLYSEKILAKNSNFISKCIDIFQAHQHGRKAIMVLNHGDFHMKNVMFKYDDKGECEDVMLIDFQVSCYGPATIDLSYSTYMLLTEDLRRHRRDEFIYFYFSIFLDTLKKIGFTGGLPTLTDLYCDLYQFKEYDLWTISTFLPLIHRFISGQEPKELEELLSTDESQASFHLMPSYLAELKWLLPRLLYNGYLD